MKGRRSMRSKAKRFGSILLLVALSLILTACFGHWFTPPQTGKLIVGPPVRIATHYEVLISVADMPDGGVAGVQLGTVALPAIEFANVNAATIVAEGSSGFEITAQGYSAAPPVEGYLVAVYSGAPIVAGPILKLSFEAMGVPTVTLNDSRIWLTNDVPAWIAGWSLETGAAYYTKGVSSR